MAYVTTLLSVDFFLQSGIETRRYFNSYKRSTAAWSNLRLFHPGEGTGQDVANESNQKRRLLESHRCRRRG